MLANSQPLGAVYKQFVSVLHFFLADASPLLQQLKIGLAKRTSEMKRSRWYWDAERYDWIYFVTRSRFVLLSGRFALKQSEKRDEMKFTFLSLVVVHAVYSTFPPLQAHTLRLEWKLLRRYA